MTLSRADRAGAVATGEPDKAIRQLIATGVEQGYLLREEIDAVLPVDVTASRRVRRRREGPGRQVRDGGGRP